VEPKSLKRDIIDEYSQFASSVYAPRQIVGKYPDSKSCIIKMDPVDLNTVQGLSQLERSLPKSITSDVELRPTKATRSTHSNRKDKVVAAYLEDMDRILKLGKTAQDSKEPDVSLPAWKKKVEKIVRPQTPNITNPEKDEADNFENAIIMLQKLLRGRAVQNRMFEGREKHSSLIKELRLEEKLQAAAGELTALDISDGVKLTQKQTITASIDALYGEVMASMLDFTTKHLVRMQAERRVAALVERAESERRRRENEEGGRREAEDIIRQRQDNIFHQLVLTHQATVDSFLHSIISETSERAALSECKKLSTVA
jgi:hypothetical protein